MIFFIAIILSIAIELSIKPIESWRRFGWFAQFTDWVNHQMSRSTVRDGPLVVLAILAPVLFALWLVSALLGHVWGVFEFVFSVAVLSASLGPRDPIRQVQDYLKSSQQGDTAAANEHASLLLGQDIDSNANVSSEEIRRALLIKVCSGILAVFFWFILLGAVGAAMFRLTCLLRERFTGVQGGLAHSITDLYHILMWIPARLTVFGFAIVGSFVDALHALQNVSELWQRDSDALLADAGLGAIHRHPQKDDETGTAEPQTQQDVSLLEESLSLVKRTVLAWVTILALIVIVSWIF